MIKKPSNYDNVEINAQLDAGGFILKIVKAEYVPAKDYIKVFFDIAEGSCKDYYAKKAKLNNGNWNMDAIKYLSLKNEEKAIKAFKTDMACIEKSNNYTWDWEEQNLVGKKVGAVFGRIQYQAKDGTLKFRTKLDRFRSVEAIVTGNFEVPAPKFLEITDNGSTDFLSDAKAIASFMQSNSSTFEISDEDLPF